MQKEAKFWNKKTDKKTQCILCSHQCKINNKNFGICNVRKNEDGKLLTMIYGTYSSMAVDPIEKKPLYHFHPKTNAFSLGTIGCNFKCLHCQNYSISSADLKDSSLREIKPDLLINMAKDNNCQGLAWTYNEPTIWYEFTYDCSKLAKKDGLYTVYVTNGFISEDPLREISPFLDAMNVDVKSFNDDFYKKVCKARLEPVLNTCELAFELKIHLELTYLVIPGYNDTEKEISKFCGWVVDKIDCNTPVHFSRFHPDFKMIDVSPTPLETLNKCYKIARENGILYPFLGNVSSGDCLDTICPRCGFHCIKRDGYSVNIDGISDVKCLKCGKKLPIVI